MRTNRRLAHDQAQSHMRLKLIGIMAFILLLGLWGCSEDALKNETESLGRGVPDEISKNVKLREYNEGALDYVLEAEEIQRFSDRRMLYGYKVQLSSYNKDGSLNSVIIADSTSVDDARNIIIVGGKVKLTTPEAEVHTEKMIWDRNVDEIIVPTAVSLYRAGDVLRGNSLRTDSRLSFAEMDAVSAEGYFDEEEFSW